MQLPVHLYTDERQEYFRVSHWRYFAIGEILDNNRGARMNDHPSEQLKATLDLIPASSWYANPSGGVTFVNKRNADYRGIPSDHPLRLGAVKGAPWDSHISLLHPDDHDDARKVWSTCLKTGQAGEITFRVRNQAGGYRWFLSRAEPFRADDGTLLGWIGINFDIDEHKLGEVELRRSKAYLAEAQKLSRTGVVGMEASTKRMFWSEEAARIYGYPPGTEPTPDLILQRSHPDDVGLVKDALVRAAQGGDHLDYEHRLVMPDGSIKHLHDHAHRVRDEAGNYEIVGAIVDITERKRAEDKIREQETELRQMLDLAPQMICVQGSQRERLYANRQALKYFGVTLEEWRESDYWSFVHPDDVDGIKARVDRSSLVGTASELEMRLKAGDGTYRWFLVRYNPLHDDQGRLVRWYIACTDIEDRKKAEERLQQENVALREEIDKTSMFEEIVGASPALTALLSRVSKVAGSDSTVLVTGETGTGKELVARAIHRRSRRSSGAFVAVNCAAISRELLASELFGHEKGAFTGATQRRLGRFELADGGTIFLDEVGELFSETQVMLLRVLQERIFERVGGTQPIRVDVRVIAATNRDLNAAVDGGTFRQDLFYRLNVFPLEAPPLRQRREDIPVLVEYFINHYSRKAGKTFRRINKRTLDRLRSYPWPGNVRELQNVIERSVIVCDSDEFAVDESWLSARPSSESRLPLLNSLAIQEKTIIEDALRASGGRVFGPSGAAERLGIPRSTLESKIRTLKIDKSRFRPRPARSSS
jgi:formate hydrogenlyase transcriptional activator